MQLLEALQITTKTLAADLEMSNLINHAGDKGEYREATLGKCLRSFLPLRFGIGSGMAFHVDGRSSRQLDIVLYDDVYFPVLLRHEYNSLFPCEWVYGSIEVKTMLKTADLRKSVENIQSLKSLDRLSAGTGQVTPGLNLEFETMINQFGAGNPYIGVVFAYGSIEPATLCRVLNSYRDDPNVQAHSLPDYIFIYEKGDLIVRARNNASGERELVWFGYRSTGTGWEPLDYDRFDVFHAGTDLLPVMVVLLNLALSMIYLRAVD